MKFIKWMVPAVIGAMTLGLTACGSDDDDNDDADYNDANSGSVISGENGQKMVLTAFGNINYGYNSRGFLSSFNSGTINWNTMILSEDGDDYEIEINAQGYITEADLNQSWSQDGDRGTYNEEYDFRYNGNGELASITGRRVEKGVEDGEAYNESGSLSCTLSWSNGVLTGLTASGKGSNGFDSYTETAQLSFTYGADAPANKSRQHCAATSVALLEDPFTLIAPTGIFGKGSAKFPTAFSMKTTFNYPGEEPEVDEESHTVTYTLNADGTLNTEVWDGTTQFNYSYSNFEAASKIKVQNSEVIKLIKGMRTMQSRHARR